MKTVTIHSELSDNCSHTITHGREGKRGSWCLACGMKVYDVDERQCKDCTNSASGLNGVMICKKYFMHVTPTMNVTFDIAKGSCWEAKAHDNKFNPENMK